MASLRHLLLSCVAIGGLAANSPAVAFENQSDPDAPQTGDRSILVIGNRSDLQISVIAQSELDENDIAAYGFDTIGDLIAQVAREVDLAGDGPVVLINGQATNGISDIADLPTEAATAIQVLPSSVSARLGYAPSRPVINVQIKPDLRQVTANVETGWSTRMDAWRGRAEANLLSLKNFNRRSLVLGVKRDDGLLESDRSVAPPTLGLPYDVVGNVLGGSGTGTEIDPALSSIVGQLTTLAGVPANADAPTLAQFAALANNANLTDQSGFRSLTNTSETFSLNANVTQRLDGDTTISNTVRVDHTIGSGLIGLAPALLVVPASSPFSPFSTDVQLARLVGTPLRQDQRSTSLAVGLALNSRVSRFSISANLGLNLRNARNVTDRDFALEGFQAAIADGTSSPFQPLSDSLLGPARQDISKTKGTVIDGRVSINGPLFDLPAGAVRMTAQAGARLDRYSSSTRGVTNDLESRLSRDEVNGQVNIQVPILSGAKGGIGSLSIDGTAGVKEISRIGTLATLAGALDWSPSQTINFRVEVTDEEVPIFGGLLNDAIVVTDNYRTFDFLREETVLVRFVTGGNPDLPQQKRQLLRLSALVRPLASTDLTFNAEYNRLTVRNAVAALPPASAEIQQAFPDRFIRDADGVLVELDARPVSLARERTEFLRWSVNFQDTLGMPSRSTDTGMAGTPTLGAGWRITARLDHSWYLSSNRLIRPGLPLIDLLDGGAAGYGGGQQEHQVNFDVSAFHRGIGIQVFSTWNSGSVINAGAFGSPNRLTFAPQLSINTRTFVNLGSVFREENWLENARLSLEVTNLFDSKTRVRDQDGSTPERYQPFLIEPIGRAFQISLRKAF